MSFNPYEVIGGNIDKNSDEKTIKAAYRKACIANHPDRQGGKTDEEKKQAEDKFKDVQKAYSILSDPNKKQKYDMFGIVDDGSNQAQSGGFNGDPFEDIKNMFGGGGSPFDDIRNMFGGGFGGGTRRKPIRPGADKSMKIPLSIKDVYLGVTFRPVKYTIQVRCPNCHGSGGKTETCPDCKGSGRTYHQEYSAFGVVRQEIICPKCGGTGQIVKEKCPSCNGSGFKDKEVTLDVCFRPGVKHGESAVFPQKGSESKDPNGPTGSFFAVAQWNFDTERYNINGYDVIEKIQIPYEDAILGCKKTVVLPDDNKIEVSIPERSLPGKLLKLKGKGIKADRPNVQGDYYLEINYTFPEVMTDEEKNKLLEIREIHNK